METDEIYGTHNEQLGPRQFNTRSESVKSKGKHIVTYTTSLCQWIAEEGQRGLDGD